MKELIKNIISDIQNEVKSNSPDTLFLLKGFTGQSFIDYISTPISFSDSEKEKLSISLRKSIQVEKPDFVISACIGLMKPINFSKKKHSKREVLIVLFENKQGIFHIANFYINRQGKKKVLGFSPAWSYDEDTIKANNFTMAGVLCSWYLSLEEVNDYISAMQVETTKKPHRPN
tara:strand:- start:2813 stop:3334 length:522 start_codon:yes stop_codon:yes gene_type:complete